MAVPSQFNFIIDVRVICIMLFIMGIISANAVPRILGLLKGPGLLNQEWVPGPSSVVNYVGRAGLGMLDHFVTKNRAPCLADVECIGLDIDDNWSGDNVSTALTKIFDRSGYPAAIVKDGGTDLAKGVSLLPEQCSRIFEVRDIGHAVANILKALYSKNELLSTCLNLVNSGRKRLCHSMFASLKPPRIRSKGRFQGISRVMDWIMDVIRLIESPDSVPEGTLVHARHKAFPELGKLRPFVEQFRRDCLVLNAFMKILKTSGLNQKTNGQGKQVLEDLPKKSGIRKEMMKWLGAHMRIQCLMGIGQTGLPVSSDVIESLMGSMKAILGRSPCPEFGTLTLAVPLLCGELDKKRIADSLTRCPYKTLTRWRSENCQNTHRKVRRKYLPEKKTRLYRKTQIVAQQ